MPQVEARTTVRYELHGMVRSPDGFEINLGELDDSFRCWRRIVAWNWRTRKWSALRMNARHLVTKVLWRKLWRRS